MTPEIEKPSYMAHCGHEPPQSPSQLHGVCIFCYRDRLGQAHRELEAALAAVRDAVAPYPGDRYGSLIDRGAKGSYQETWHSKHATIIALAQRREGEKG